MHQKSINNVSKVPTGKVSRKNFFQPKLTINQPGDSYEHEADAMADKVMRSEDPAIQKNFFSPAIVQRKCAQCEEEEKAQRKETSSEPTEASPQTENYISSLSGGKSLSGEERNFFESRMGHDFSNVRLHTDTTANESAKNLSALAYTQGNNIVFGNNQYQPSTNSGKQLLAHELTHVIQQNSATISRAPENWWDEKGVSSKASKKLWDDIHLFFPKDGRKFAGSGMDNVANLDLGADGTVRIGKGYWDEADAMKRKAWLVTVIEKRDVQRYDQARIDNEDLTNDKITAKLKALTGTDLQGYVKKLTDMGKFVTNDQVLAYLNGDDKAKTQIVKDATDKLLDWKFDNDRLTDADFRDERISTRLRGLSAADMATKETKAKEFATNTGEDTTKLQEFLKQQQGTATPMPADATATAGGGFTMSLPNVDLIVLPDTSGGKGNETSFSTNLPTTAYQFSISGDTGLITSFFRMNGKTRVLVAFPTKLVITIQTRFADVTNADQTSAYGRGTTTQDLQWGGKTLRFHEGSHGKGFIDFIQSHTWPSIAIGSVTQADLQSINTMTTDMATDSCTNVDQVGVTQDDYIKTKEGKASGIKSCTK